MSNYFTVKIQQCKMDATVTNSQYSISMMEIDKMETLHFMIKTFTVLFILDNAPGQPQDLQLLQN